MGKRELSIGSLVHNRYRVEKVLGQGGFGITYRVMDLKDGCTAAMKEYMPLDIAFRPLGRREVRPTSQSKQNQYEKFKQYFLREAHTVYQFRGHPNIVEVRHLFSENNTAYYVMEYIEGMDLGHYLKSQGGFLDWAALRPIAAQVVSALQQVHKANVIHCDISPNNIFLTHTGSVKLLDFGAARNTLRGSVEVSAIVANMSYAPWEQLRGRNLGPWTDVYALAATIYHCTTGRLPPNAQERIVRDDTVWPSELGIAIPSRDWENALRKAMSVQPSERWQRVTDFWSALIDRDSKVSVHPSFDSVQPETKLPLGTFITPEDKAPALKCVQGAFAGKSIRIRQEICLGTDGTCCQIVYPPGTPGISRVHLRLWQEGGRLMIMDMGSTYGTWLGGKRMMPGLAYRLPSGVCVNLGKGQVFRAAESI